MNTLQKNPEENPNSGIVPSESKYETLFARFEQAEEAVSTLQKENDEMRIKLEDTVIIHGVRTRRIVEELMMEANAPAMWLQGTPDQWIMSIMNKLRSAAVNIKEFSKFRRHLLKTAAALLVAIKAADDTFSDHIESKN